MSKENFYIYEELQAFTNNFTDCSIINISKFIETKTNKQYCVIKKELIKDFINQYRDNNQGVLDIKMFSMNIWEKINLQNHQTINKWKSELIELGYFDDETANGGDSK